MLTPMQDLFTEADRARVNAAMAEGSEAAYASLLAAEPGPSVGRRILVLVGAFVVGLIAAVILGAVLSTVVGSIGRIIGILILIGAVVAGWPLASALHRRSLRSRARDEVVGGFAAERGWEVRETMTLIGETPFLRLGDSRRTRWGLNGSIDGEVFCCGHFEYETRETRTVSNADGTSSTTTDTTVHPFTIAMLPLDSPEFARLRLGPGSFLGLGAKVSGLARDTKRIELESSEFDRSYDMVADAGADDAAIRQRFTPAVQMAFVERGVTKDQVELENGVLLVARKGRARTDDFGSILDVLAEAVWIRAVLVEDPAGRLPDPAPLRSLLLGPAA
jgi:hypothetical protein